MPLLNIKSMIWADPTKSSVTIVGDTHEGNDMITTTAYSSESGLWDAIKDYDKNLIGEYVAPPEPPATPMN